MAVRYSGLKKSLKQGGAKKKKFHSPPSFIYRDEKEYKDLEIVKVGEDTFTVRPEFLKTGNKGSLYFSAVVKSEYPSRKNSKAGTDVAPSYKVTVKFEDVIFSDKPKKELTGSIELSNGKTKYFRTPSFSRKEIRVRCQCADFRHRFEHQLKAVGGLFGNARKFKGRTTPKPENGGRPYANATNKLGFCKHIKSLHTFLTKNGYVNK